MLSHVHIGITDFRRAFEFYSALFAPLDLQLKFNEPKVPWAGWVEKEHERPLFIIGRAFNGKPATSGNGQMIALLAKDRKTVDLCYENAISAGAICDGPPGLRPQYHSNYYGAYVLDLDGNKLCICTHGPDS